jgi:periplasmic protein TonB
MRGPAAPKPPGEAGSGSGVASAVGRGTGDTGAGHGDAGDDEGAGDDYLERLRRWLKHYQHYPEAAKKADQEGHVLVSFTILPDGRVVDPRIKQSSGFPLLDEAALKMLHDGSPVPPPPARYHPPGTVTIRADFTIGLMDRLF